MDEFLKQLIPLILSANTLALTWLVGDRRTIGWVLGCGGQVVWFLFIFTWQVWGLLPLAMGLTVVYGRNLYRWRRETSEENTEALSDRVMDVVEKATPVDGGRLRKESSHMKQVGC